MENIIIFAIIGAAIFFSGVYFFITANKRKEMNARIINELGFESMENFDYSYFEKLGFKIFSIGRSRKILSVLKKETESETIFLIDHSYVNGTGTGYLVPQTILLRRSNFLNLPSFNLSYKNFHNGNTLAKIYDANLFSKEDFDEYPKIHIKENIYFHAKYTLRGEDSGRVKKLFTPEIMSFFAKEKNISIEAKGNALAYYRTAKRVKPKEIDSFLEEAEKIYYKFRD